MSHLADLLTDSICKVAAAYPEDARHTLRKERDEHFTVTQRLAWLYRFGSVEEYRQALAELATCP